METNMTKVMFSESTFEEDLKMHGVNNKNYKSILLVPINPKLPTIDALILPNICLQITKQPKGHAIAATKSFEDLLDKIEKFCAEERIKFDKFDDENKFRFIFIVQSAIFNTFGPQEVQCTEDLSENFRNKQIEFPKDILRNIEKSMDNPKQKSGDDQNQDAQKQDAALAHVKEISPGKVTEIIEIAKENNVQRRKQIQKVNQKITQFVLSLHVDLYQQLAKKRVCTKTTGNSILDKTVLTIMDVKSEPTLRVLAMKILGDFLLNTDNNILYVALDTLLKVVNANMESIQRHRETIVECLKYPDVSIKRLAMELSFALINQTNVVQMINELMSFLETCETELKKDCSSKMLIAINSHALSKRWHVDSMQRVLKTAGNDVHEDIVTNFIALVSNTPDEQFYAMSELVKLCCDDVTQQPLVHCMCWCVGEYGGQYAVGERLTKECLADLLISVIKYNNDFVTREYAINALVKLTTRFSNLTEHVQNVMSGCDCNINLQQRAVEYNAILRKYKNINDGLFEQMPVPEITLQTANTSYGNTSSSNLDEFDNNEETQALIGIFSDETTVVSRPKAAHSSEALPKPINSDILNFLDSAPIETDKPADKPKNNIN